MGMHCLFFEGALCDALEAPISHTMHMFSTEADARAEPSGDHEISCRSSWCPRSLAKSLHSVVCAC